VLTQNNEDFEWYPTTDEIFAAMKKDILSLFKNETVGRWRDRDFFDTRELRSNESGYIYVDKGKKIGIIRSFLDVGAGDGRVFPQINGEGIEIENRYGIEISQPFADNLLMKDDVFLIGRDFFKTSLMDKRFSVIFSNPPYSIYQSWIIRLLKEANFVVMYLVIPVRWDHNREIMHHMGLYDVDNLGEYDFLDGDRPARARVNLIRVIKRRDPNSDIHGHEYGEFNFEEDAFDRWIHEHIGSFEEPELELPEEKDLKLKNDDIGDLVENYEYEMASLLQAFKALGSLPARIVSDLGMDKYKIVKQIKKNIAGLKDKYWHAAFDKLNVINSRLTKNTRNEMLTRMAEFKTLDFNEENIYSIVLWVIKNFNKYTGQQIIEVFDKLTSQSYIKAYKSNVHWLKDNWRYTQGKGKPEKYILDYRLVTRCYVDHIGYSVYQRDSILEDLKVICGSLGYQIPAWEQVDYSQDGSLQEFHTSSKNNREVAFTARLYKNQNLHLKINEKIMLRFNIEVARLRHWINGPKDIEREYDVPEKEAIKLWREPALLRIGRNDVLQLGFIPGEEIKSA
jgi:hypothetical protein